MIPIRNVQQVAEIIVPLKEIECGVCGNLIIIYPKPYSIYLRGTIYRDVERFGILSLGAFIEFRESPKTWTSIFWGF